MCLLPHHLINHINITCLFNLLSILYYTSYQSINYIIPTSSSSTNCHLSYHICCPKSPFCNHKHLVLCPTPSYFVRAYYIILSISKHISSSGSLACVHRQINITHCHLVYACHLYHSVHSHIFTNTSNIINLSTLQLCQQLHHAQHHKHSTQHQVISLQSQTNPKIEMKTLIVVDESLL